MLIVACASFVFLTPRIFVDAQEQNPPPTALGAAQASPGAKTVSTPGTPPTDRVWGHTNTWWLVLQTIIILVLSGFAARAATKSAEAAASSLKILSRQQELQASVQEAGALDAILSIYGIVAQKRSMLYAATPIVDLRLLPNSWLHFIEFMMLENKSFGGKIEEFHCEIYTAEMKLGTYYGLPLASRQPGSQNSKDINETLDNVVKLASSMRDEFNKKLSKSKPPA
jgi:hypothetical protein